VGVEAEFLYLNSSDTAGYRYSGPILDPAASLTFRITPVVNVDLGMRWHIINGTMTGEKAGTDQPFSNADYQRFYLVLCAVSPWGAYGQVDFAASKAAISNHFNDGLQGAALGFRIGVLLDYKKTNAKISERNSAYFPEYDKMKKRQDAMEEDLK
jgi:hypothetical protein